MKRETTIKLVKVTVGLVSGIAVLAVTSAAIKNLVPVDELPKINKVIMGIGIGIISGMVADEATTYAENFVDSFFTGTQIGFKTIEEIAPKE